MSEPTPGVKPSAPSDPPPAARGAAAARRLITQAKAMKLAAVGDYYRGFLAGVDEAAAQILEAIGPQGE